MASIGRASAILASGTLVSRVLGFVKALMLVQTIGAVGVAANAYGNATIVPNSIYAIIAQGLLNAILVPQIVRAAVHADGGRAYINKLVTVGIVIFAAVAIVATIFAGPLMHLFGARGSVAVLATAFAFWSLPQIFFLGLYTLLGEVLNARKSFGPFTWAPVLNNVVGIGMLGIFIWIFGADPGGLLKLHDWTPTRIAILAGGATLGIAVQAVVLFFFWKRVGLTFKPDFHWRGVNLGTAGRAAGWTFAMLLGTQLAGLIETNIANTAGTHNPSVFLMSNAWLVFMLPHSIIAVSIVTALYTHMAEDAHRGDMVAFKADYSRAIRSVALFIVFAGAALIVVALPFSRVFTQFYAEMAPVLIGYLVGLIPFSLLFVTQRAFYSLGDTRTPFLFTIAQVGLIIIGVFSCLAVPADLRAAAIALVVSLAGTIQAIIAAILLHRRIGSLDGRRIVGSLWRYVVAALVSAGVGFIVLVLLGGLNDGFAVSGFIQAIAAIAVIGIVMIAVYLGVLVLVRSSDLRDGLAPITNRLRRG